MSRKIELLAPGGSLDSIKAAIVAGADAVYCGLNQFNARNRAENIVFADLNGLLHLAHQHNCQLFLTLNILIVESEFPALIRLLNKLVNTSIDGVIVQDIGMLYLLERYFPSLAVHASTQLTTHNEGQIRFLKHLAVQRVNFCRELSLAEIRELTEVCHENKMATEVFVHGSLCLGFSGLCYLSSMQSGNSGNRGRCSQPCRDSCETTEVGKTFPLNLKDNSVFSHVGALIAAGVDSLKIEGRIKKFHYVHTVVRAFRKQIDCFKSGEGLKAESRELFTVFNRDFTNGFLQGKIHRGMFIDNPRDHSALHRVSGKGGGSSVNLNQAKQELYDLKTDIITTVRSEIDLLSIEKAPLDITVFGVEGGPLQVLVKTPETSFTVSSQSPLLRRNKSGDSKFNARFFKEKFKGVNDTEYFLTELHADDLVHLFIPFKELVEIKKRIVRILRDGREIKAEVCVASPVNTKQTVQQPALSVLISAVQDIPSKTAVGGEIYFELPSYISTSGQELLALFSNNEQLIPWFPPVLLGEDYQHAVEFLKVLRPKRIVTDNTGIAFEAMGEGIDWLAGPYFNIVNSFSLKCLQEKFNCVGAFISTELNRQQIRKIRRPADFELHFSIFHPIVLLTSRQCLLQQVTGCEKSRIDAACLGQCQRSAVLKPVGKEPVLIKKRKGHHHALYHQVHCLNTDIVTEVPDLFSGFCVDLRDIRTETVTEYDQGELIRLFTEHLAGDMSATMKLKQEICPTTNRQYAKGI